MSDREHDSHFVRDTSLLTYGWLKNIGLGENQQKVFDIIKKFSGLNIHLTDREISDHLEYGDPNKVRPRRYELMKEGLIVESDKRICSISGRIALTWKVPDHLLNHSDDELFRKEGEFLIQVDYLQPLQWNRMKELMNALQYYYVGDMKWRKRV